MTLRPSYGAVEREIAFLIGESPEQIDASDNNGAYGPWRSAQIRSWSVPVACCSRCRREEVASGGLTERGTTHSKCWPEAWAP